MRKTTFALLVAVSLPLVTAHAAHADEPAASPTATEDARARGKQLFDAALADVKREDFKAACPKFKASYEVDPKASTLLNLGTCYERNGQTASAWGAFSSAVVAARKAGKEEWAAQADERVRALEPRLVRLTVTVPAEARAEGLVISRDGAKLSESEWGLAMAVDPGEHLVKADAPGRVGWSTKVAVAEGTKVPDIVVPNLALAPVAKGQGPTKIVVEGPPPYWTATRVGGVTAAGIGLAAAGVGVALGFIAKGKYDDSRRTCPEPGTTCSDAVAVNDNETAFSLATGSTVLVVAGGVLAAAGVGLFLWAPDAHKSKKTQAFRVVPSGGPGALGLELGGAF